MNKNTEFAILGNSVGKLLRFLGQAKHQGLFCHLFHSDYCVAASARNLLHSYVTFGSTSLQQTQPYYLNHLSLGHCGVV